MAMQALLFQLRPPAYAACLLLKRFWPGCVYSPLGGLSLRDLPTPSLPGPEWALCRTVLGGICGTDLAILHQRQPIDSILQCFSTFPGVLGHENVAVVEQVGPAVDKSWLGKQITAEPTLCCAARGIEPACGPCRRGQYGACENFSANGLGKYRLPPGTSIGYCGAVGGSWSQYFLAHASQLIELPGEIPPEVGVLTDPLACSLHAVLRADLSAARSVLVYGAGILGLGVVWALRAVGYAGQIDVIARHRHQADWARKLGAGEILALPRRGRERHQAIADRTGGRLLEARFGNFTVSGGYDVLFECVGTKDTLQEALKWTGGRGQVVLVATGHARGADLTPIWFSELNVLGAYGRSEESFGGRRIHTYRLTHEFMRKDPGLLAGLLSHTFALDQYREALSTASDKSQGSIKVAFRFA